MRKTEKSSETAGARSASGVLVVVSRDPLFCDACQKLVHRLVTGGSSAGDFIR